MSKEYITDYAWNKIYTFLKQCKGIYLSSEKKIKSFIEAVLWMVKNGTRWRAMCCCYGNWNSIYKRFYAWSMKGIWEKLFNFCIEDPDCENILIDSTIVRSNACSAGYGDQKKQALGRSRGGFTTKIHVAVDALSNPLKILLTPGQRHDVTQMPTLLKGFTKANIIADRAYGSAKIRKQIKDQDCTAVIPPRKNAINPEHYDKDLYKERHNVECFFSKIKHFRRVFSRFDKSARSYLSFLYIVSAFMWLR